MTKRTLEKFSILYINGAKNKLLLNHFVFLCI
jgi:hypothetical protein